MAALREESKLYRTLDDMYQNKKSADIEFQQLDAAYIQQTRNSICFVQVEIIK